MRLHFMAAMKNANETAFATITAATICMKIQISMLDKCARRPLKTR